VSPGCAPSPGDAIRASPAPLLRPSSSHAAPARRKLDDLAAGDGQDSDVQRERAAAAGGAARLAPPPPRRPRRRHHLLPGTPDCFRIPAPLTVALSIGLCRPWIETLARTHRPAGVNQ
jgi:hypothetical protein